MESTTIILRSPDEFRLIWTGIFGLFCIYLVGLGVMTFAAPQLARRFLGGFASNVWINLLEVVLRFLAGLALMGVSPDSQYPQVFFYSGGFMCLSAIPLLLLPKTHRRFAEMVVPFALRILPVFGGLSILLGGFLLWSVFA